MEVTAGVCQSIANVLVVLMLAVIIDRKAIVRTTTRGLVMGYVFVMSAGVTIAVQGSGDGLGGVAGVAVFGIFVLAMGGVVGMLGALIYTDSRD